MPNCLVIVPVPEVEPYVARLREQFDRSAKRGLGAHITLLHAPLPSGGIAPAMFAALANISTTTAAFAYAVTQTGRFPGTLYLAVEPVGAFNVLNQRLAQTSLDTSDKPFVPHISIVRRGAAGDDEPGVERELMQMLVRQGPVHCKCLEIVLLEDSTGMWRSVRRFALSGGTGSPSPAPS